MSDQGDELVQRELLTAKIPWGMRDAFAIWAGLLLATLLSAIVPSPSLTLGMKYALAILLVTLTVGIVTRKYGLRIAYLGWLFPPRLAQSSLVGLTVGGGLAAGTWVAVRIFYGASVVPNNWSWPHVLQIASLIPFVLGSSAGFFNVIVLPFAEELYFRGFLCQAIAKQGHPLAVVTIVQAVFFAVFYLNPFTPRWGFVLGHFVGGLALGWLFIRYKTLLPGLLCHMTFNLFQNLALVSSKFVR